MNIIMITCEYNIGGGERNLLDVVEEQKKEGNHVFVVLPFKGQLLTELKKINVDTYCYGLTFKRKRWLMGIPIFLDIVWMFKLISILKSVSFRPNIVHSYSLNTVPIGFLISRFFNIKHVWTCHGPWELNGWFKSFFLNKLVDCAITIIPEILLELKHKNKQLISLGARNIDKIRDNNIRDKNKIKLLCVARFQKIKGQDILIKSFNMLCKKYQILELHFFGATLTADKNDLKFFNEIKQYAIDNSIEKKVFFHGFEPQIRSKMKNYDLLCIPSRYESFSITCVEGMLNGMMIVAPNVAGPKYLIQDNINGILFQSGNYIDLAKKIEKIINGAKLNVDDIIKRGEKFTIKAQVRKLNILYSKLKK